MARLPNGGSRMLCALLQFGSVVSAVNRPSPRDRAHPAQRAAHRLVEALLVARARRRDRGRTRRRAACPSCRARRSAPIPWPAGPDSAPARSRSSDSMLPTTGLVGGCGIGLSLLVDAIAIVSPALVLIRHCERSEAIARRRSKKRIGLHSSLRMPRNRYDRGDVHALYPNRFLRHSISLALTSSGFSCCVQWPLPRTRYFSRSGTIFSMPSAADGGSTAIVLGHDHQRRHPHRMVDPGRALPVARHVAVPVDAAGEAGFGEGVDEHLLFLRRQDRRARIVLGVVVGDHLRKRQIEPRRSADAGDRLFRRRACRCAAPACA